MRSVTVKVADFGIVREYGEGELGTTGVGTVAYMSPERLHVEEGVGYSFVADVWAVGLIAGECAQGRHLYPDEVQTVTTNGCLSSCTNPPIGQRHSLERHRTSNATN